MENRIAEVKDKIENCKRELLLMIGVDHPDTIEHRGRLVDNSRLVLQRFERIIKRMEKYYRELFKLEGQENG